MKNKIILTALIALFAICKSIGQITTSIVDVLVNNQTTVSNCGLIDLGSTTNNTLTVNFKLTKPANQAVSTVIVNIYLKYSSSTNPGTILGSYSVPNNVWTNGDTKFEGSIPVSLSASEIQDTGSSLYAKVDSNSCEYPLKKTQVPTFTLSPASVSISCNSTAPITYTVNNVYNSPGTVVYNWVIGSGWKYTNGSIAASTLQTTTNTLTLVPYNYPPGEVKVTTRLDNTNYPQKTATISLSGFNPGFDISGPSQTCTTASYVVNLPTGISVTNWSVSDTSIATISSVGNQTTLTAVGNGPVDLFATLTNTCNQTAQIVKTGIFVGKANVATHGLLGGFNNQSVNSYSSFNVNPVPGATQYYWRINVVSTNCNVGTQQAYFTDSQSLTYITASPYASVSWNQCPGNYVVNCYARNSCGDSPIGSKTVHVYGQNENPCGGGLSRANNDQFTVLTNPIKEGTIIVQRYPPGDPCDDPEKNKGTQKQETIITLFDAYGNKVATKAFHKNVMKIDGLNLKSGFYILEVMNGDFIKRETLVVK